MFRTTQTSMYMTPAHLLAFIELLNLSPMGGWQAVYAYVTLQQQMHQIFTLYQRLPDETLQILERNIALRQTVLPFLNEQIPSKKAELLSKGISDVARGKSTMSCKVIYSNGLLLQAMTIGKIIRKQRHNIDRQMIDAGIALLNMGIDEERIELQDLPTFISYLVFALPYADSHTQNTLVQRIMGLLTGNRYADYSRETKRAIFMYLIGCLSDSEKMDNETLTNTHIELATELLTLGAAEGIVDPPDHIQFFTLLYYLIEDNQYFNSMTDRKAMLMLFCVQKLLNQLTTMAPAFLKDPGLWPEMQRRINKVLVGTVNASPTIQILRNKAETDWRSIRPQIERFLENRAP